MSILKSVASREFSLCVGAKLAACFFPPNFSLPPRSSPEPATACLISVIFFFAPAHDTLSQAGQSRYQTQPLGLWLQTGNPAGFRPNPTFLLPVLDTSHFIPSYPPSSANTNKCVERPIWQACSFHRCKGLAPSNLSAILDGSLWFIMTTRRLPSIPTIETL